MIATNNIGRLFLAFLLVCPAAYAADAKFESSIVTESRTYERQGSSFSVGGITAAGTRVAVSRVTVARDGVLITGEWEPKTLQSATAKDFRRGTDVVVAITRNRLLLKLPDDSVVSAKIVKREKQKPPNLGRQTRD